MAKNVTRLYTQFQPAHYNLTLDIDKDKMKLSGAVVIRGLKVGRPSKRLTLHQKGLKISEAVITKKDKKGDLVIPVTRINLQRSYDEVRLHTDTMLTPGEYEVSLKFSAHINDQMHGIYPCYFKHNGKPKTLIGTQFESHHAREAFPCVDEPEAKATFDLHLISPEGEVVLGNTPVKKQSSKAGRTTTSFETSPKMSTYLLAFAIGEIHAVSAKSKTGVTVSSWATVAQPLSHLQYANDEAVKVLDFFSDYFKVPFPLKKLDQIALPDFEALAMENWGLITYREVGLLADPKNRSLSGEQLITLVISHEVSHQWFGNLVTMRWWDDLWLNESFASIMENIAPDRLHPDWHQWEDFATGRVLSCSHRDIYKEVQPVGVKVKHPDEINSIFDPAIVYAKGARLLNMMYEYIGEEDFRKGLTKYFKQHAYSNTTRDDLWRALSSVSHKDVGKLMTPWIEKPGQPLVKVKRTDKGIKFSQQRFLMDGEDTKSLWPIPLLADKPLSVEIMEKHEIEVPYKDSELPVFNINGNGHYIVDYVDADVREALSKKIIDRSVSSISRITLLNDMYLLARAGEYQLTDMIELIQKCNQEPRDAVWSMFLRLIGQAQTLTDGDVPTEEKIRVYKGMLASYWYNKLGWEDKPKDDPNTKHLRTTAVALSIASEDPKVIDKALKMFERAGSVENLPAEQRAMLAGVAVRRGKPEFVQQLMDEYVSSPNPDVQQAINVALCSTRDKEVVKRLIKWGLNEKGVVRQQDIDHWYAYLMRNHYSRDLTWQWFTSHWDYLVKLLGGGKHMEYFIWYSSGALSTPEWENKFKEFFGPKTSQPSLKRNIDIAFSEIAARVAWRQREEDSLKSYFAKV